MERGAVILLLIILLENGSNVFATENSSDAIEDNELYMRIDDMIFLRPKSRAGLSSGKFRWEDAEIPYTVQKGLSEDMREMLRDTMDVLEEHTCIEFIPRRNQKHYIYISHTDKGCYSNVGFMNRGRQRLNLGQGCWRFGTIVHELIHSIGHSIGFSHEHQRNDRDEYVTIHYEHMKPGKEHNFKLDKEMGMRFDYFGLPYNYHSVMHYSQMAFSENGKPTIVPKKIEEIEEALYKQLDEDGRPVIGLNKLTRGDVTMINRMYDDYC